MQWWNEQMLAPLFEVNERMLRQAPSVWMRAPPAFRDVELEESAVRTRLSRCPFLLVDVGLDKPERWFVPDDVGGSFFASDEAVALTRMTFLLAWSMARTDLQAAGLALGISLHVASRVAALRMDELWRVAEVRAGSARPRWMDRPQIWRRLGRVAVSDAEVPERVLWLRVVQLLFWECVHERDSRVDEHRVRVSGRFMGAHT